MRTLIPIETPKVGMKVEITKTDKCCFGFVKGEGGTIVKVNGEFDFVVRDWKDCEFDHCIQCCKEVKEVK